MLGNHASNNLLANGKSELRIQYGPTKTSAISFVSSDFVIPDAFSNTNMSQFIIPYTLCNNSL